MLNARYEVRVDSAFGPKSAQGAKRQPFESFFAARRTARREAAAGRGAVIWQLMSGPYAIRARPIWRFAPGVEERVGG